MAQSLRIRIGAAGIRRFTLDLLGPSAVPAVRPGGTVGLDIAKAPLRVERGLAGRLSRRCAGTR